MNQVLNEILSEIERAPSQVAQQQWMKMVELLRDEPDQKDSVYSRLYQVLDTNALAAPAYAKWIYALYHEADLKEALEIAEHADKRYPNSRDVLVLFGMSLRKAGQTEEAITKLNR
jgi:tetratricopeptide (TPR) repeat protein